MDDCRHQFRDNPDGVIGAMHLTHSMHELAGTKGPQQELPRAKRPGAVSLADKAITADQQEVAMPPLAVL